MCINRIRLEFKETMARKRMVTRTVLIESDWNLKHSTRARAQGDTDGINRIRLEFKVCLNSFSVIPALCINRIRLEFKVCCKN